jgi:hypothetical protein
LKNILVTLSTLLLAASTSWANEYTLDLSKSAKSLKVDEKATLTLVLKLLPGAHISDETPITVSLTSTDAIKFDKTRLSRSDAVKGSKFEFQVPFSALKAGKHEAKGSIRFYLCDTNCKRIDDNFTHVIEVKTQTKSGNTPGTISNLAGN